MRPSVKDGVIFVYFREARTTVATALKNLRWSSNVLNTKKPNYQYRSKDALIADGAERSMADPRYIISATPAELKMLEAEIDRLVAAGFVGRGIEIYHDG